MEASIKDRIIAWAEDGGDFFSGISLFLSYNRNSWYARNIEAKGEKRGLTTLLSEFSGKTKIPQEDILLMVLRSRENAATETPGIPLQNASTRDENPVLLPQRQEDQIRKSHHLRLREEFPFLRDKNCPEEFALVVHKMLTAYDLYREARERLYDIDFNDLDLCYSAGRAVLDAYILNRECWEELNHYKLTGKILGKLPELSHREKSRDYSAMSTVALIKMINGSIPRRMSYYKKQLLDPATRNMDEIRQKQQEAESESALIRKILTSRGEM